MSKSEALTTPEAAREALEMDEAEMNAAIEDGTLRRVKHGDDVFILGADVDRLQRESDPRYMARLVLDGVDPDDPESPKTLAASVPRF